jgi:hypothetical protein
MFHNSLDCSRMPSLQHNFADVYWMNKEEGPECVMIGEKLWPANVMPLRPRRVLELRIASATHPEAIATVFAGMHVELAMARPRSHRCVARVALLHM